MKNPCKIKEDLYCFECGNRLNKEKIFELMRKYSDERMFFCSKECAKNSVSRAFLELDFMLNMGV